ncbi:cytokinin dehydrogenase 3-like [Telopea speciosissima]|uniref:cytokinin dehydrogenase 3-like n=1 Tax=Telopea speciosissima TaxID=54955 RepID=UPI001CC3D81E|nr:cytokinin dehydrogenase 3-like [Telopea speciosissima]
MDSIPLQFYPPTPSETLDFGRIIQQSPSFVLKPTTPEEISVLLKSIPLSPIYNNITVAARGAGHSIYGQAQAPNGIVIDITSLPNSMKISRSDQEESKDHFFIDVSGGALWIDVLKETLKHGLTPRSWTDYLFLTVGGTLSVGGISGQTFKYGPQICNVLEMDVITGRGDFVTCSKEKNSELFYGVLGGLGQFGIIIRARIILEIAPPMVKHVRLYYSDFSLFVRDQETLISMKEVDYVEGYINLNHNSEPLAHLLLSNKPSRFDDAAATDYIIEVALFYNEAAVVQEVMDQVFSQLSLMPSSSTAQINDISYFDFLNRVEQEEKKLRNEGLWEVPHPWLNVFIPKSQIKPFKDLLLKTISAIPTNGPVLIYPILRHRWDQKMFVVLPREEEGEDVFYIVSLLRSAIPSSSLQTLLSQNQEIIDAATSSKAPIHLLSQNQKIMGGKQYMPYLRDESEWKIHFGEDQWMKFEELKIKFDPFHILAPGQMIFKRKNIEI